MGWELEAIGLNSMDLLYPGRECGGGSRWLWVSFPSQTTRVRRQPRVAVWFREAESLKPLTTHSGGTPSGTQPRDEENLQGIALVRSHDADGFGEQLVVPITLCGSVFHRTKPLLNPNAPRGHCGDCGINCISTKKHLYIRTVYLTLLLLPFWLLFFLQN